MYYIQGVFQTDDVTRSNTQFTQSALVGGTWATSEMGLPMHISHDLASPIGWNYLSAVYFEPNWTRVAGYGSMPETDEEWQQLRERLHAFHSVEISKYSDDIAQLRKLLEKHLSDEAKLILVECLSFTEPGLAARTFPKIFARQNEDRDYLFPLNELKPLGLGVFQVGELALFAHSYFRRRTYRMNSLNSAFFRYVEEVTQEGIEFKIALDPDMVGLACTYHEKIEHAYWRGPKFSDDLKSIKPGVTQHEAIEEHRLHSGIVRTEFWWHSRQGIHTLEAEELPDREDGAKCRYVHAQVDEATGSIMHFDGAIREYAPTQFTERLASDIMHFGRRSNYTKLWRTDGELSVPQWKRLLSDYYRDNFLVGEYLGAEPDVKLERPAYVDRNIALTRVERDYTPYTMNAGNGIRLSISFHAQRQLDAEFQVIPLDYMGMGSDPFLFVEADTIELRKLLKRNGHTLSIPDNIKVIYFKDFYANLPLIVTGYKNPTAQLKTLIDGLKGLVDAWVRKDFDKVVVCNFGFPVEEKEVWISIMGHISDIRTWFASDFAYPPVSKEELIAWGDKVADYLRTTFPEARNQPYIFDILQTRSGILQIQREILNRSETKFTSTEVGLMYEMPLPADEELVEALQAQRIVPALIYINPTSICRRCKADYRTCDCSKTLDSDVVQEITSVEGLYQFWTDRPVT